jgi:hypothetical protein
VIVNLVLWVGGVGALAAGIALIRAPLARLNELRRLAANAERYESWRGGRRAASDAPGRTGADEMMDVLRRRIQLWAVLIVAGVVLIVAGFLVR